MVQAKMKFLFAFCVVSIGMILLSTSPPVFAQQQTNVPAQKQTKQDEYSAFDDKKSEQQNTANFFIAQKLEKARQKYLKALTAIENDDTLSIPRLFEDAIQALNSLASYPGIESNEDFADLAQSIIDDYESYVQIIDSLPESSSAFVLRNKIYQEVEEIDSSLPALNSLQFANSRVSGAPGAPAMTIPMDINEHVQKNINFLSQDKGRKFFKKWLEKSGRWFPLLKRIAKEEDMPEEIIYLAMIESALNPNAVSWAKAVGMWQFMQAAASDYGLVMNSWVDERRDPEKSTRAAMRYLKWLYNEFGDWHLALAAYNSGPNGPVRRGIARIQKDSPTFWDIREYLPKETKNYVPLFLATAIITMNQEQYGFTKDEMQYEPEYNYELFPVDGSISLKALAKCIDQPVDILKSLNPELLGSTTPADIEKPYELKIPIGMKSVMAANFNALSEEEKNPWVIHPVDKGETIASIANQYGINQQDIINNNQIGNGKKLKKGSSLRIPRELVGTSLASANKIPTSDSIPDRVTAPIQQTSTTISSEFKSTPSSSSSTTSTLVAEASTINNINDKPIAQSTISSDIPDATITVDKQNSTETIETVIPNITVTVPSTTPEVKQSQPALQTIVEEIQADNTDDEEQTVFTAKNTTTGNQLSVLKSGRAHSTHIVKAGETLYSLAQRYGVRMTDLRNWNGIAFDNNTLMNGQELIISSTASPKVVYLQADKHKSPVITTQKASKHRVKKGETLAQIADDYNVDLESLKKLNKITKSNKLTHGTILRIPGERYADERASRASVSRKSSAQLKVHSLKKGETLSKIAAMYNVSERDLRSWNPKLVTTKMVRGQKIKLYSKFSSKGSSSDTRSRSSSRLPKQYKVRKGDTMGSIADKFGVSLQQLKSKNKKITPGSLRVGQTLRLQ